MRQGVGTGQTAPGAYGNGYDRAQRRNISNDLRGSDGARFYAEENGVNGGGLEFSGWDAPSEPASRNNSNTGNGEVPERRRGAVAVENEYSQTIDRRVGAGGQYSGPRIRHGSNDAPGSRNGSGAFGPATISLDGVLQAIRRDWDFMSQDNCVPVQIALQLSDKSSLGRANRLRDFKETRRSLELALQAIVNEHHQGFNSSIGTYHSIMRSITNSQTKVRLLREKLLTAKKDLTSDRPEVKNLAVESQRYEDMLQILTTIEQLRGVPEKLDLRISEKRFLTAVELLSESLKNTNKPEMTEIGALQDLRRNLENQESSLAAILVEELHSHLYLKSPYCDVRWKSYQAMKESKVPGIGADSQGLFSAGNSKRPFQQFLDTEDLDTEMVEDASRNIEAESLHYIRLLIESLHSLGHLPNALEEISQRLPVELNKVVDKTNMEVDSRHSASVRGKLQTFKDGKSIELCLSESDPRVEVLYDLLYTLYSKFESILEGYRVIHDVVKGIMKRDWSKETSTSNSMSGGFLEVWKLIQSEIRSLLHDYLTTNESKGTTNITKASQNSVNSILMTNTSNRDRRKMFKLSSADVGSSRIKSNQDDLEKILKANVPGLVSDFSRPIEPVAESHETDGSATGRKLLIEPTVFNMGHLLSPSLAFLQTIKEIVPAGLGVAQSTFTSFLDDFLVNVFLPQLEDTLRDLSNQTTGELDAFSQDPQWPTIAQRPVMKGTASFYSLITAICRMLDSIPHDQAFSQLIVDLLSAYYEKCSEFFKGDANGSVNQLKKSAAWAQTADLQDVLRPMLQGYEEETKDSLQKEILVLGKLKGEVDLEYADVITERKTVYSLCLLYNSMKWLSTKVTQLRRLSEQANDTSRQKPGTKVTKRWTLVEEAQKQKTGNGTSDVYLPLTIDLVEAFDHVVATFDSLANTVLFTLRTEAHAHIAYHLNVSMKHGNFFLDNEPTEPDPSIMALNSDLVWFDEDVSTLLRPEEQTFVNSGLVSFMDQMLIMGSADVAMMNHLGMEKVEMNILVLQQNLKNIVGDAKLDRSANFYKLFEAGPQGIITSIKETGDSRYTYDELKQLITLWYSESLQANGRREASSQARRLLNNHLIELSELMWDK